MQRVLVDSTQAIVSYPRLAPDAVTSGVPTSATARRVAPTDADDADTYSAATIDSLSTTLSAAALQGDETLALAGAVTVVAGSRYLVTDATTGARVEVVPTRSGSLSVMYLSEPLPCDLATASTVNGMAVSIALDATQTDEPGSGYVLFRATVDGVVHEWDEAFRVVRRITSIALTVNELTQTYPVVRQLASSTDTTLEEAVQASWRSVIVPWLAVMGVLDENVITDDVLIPVHAAATVLHLARQWPAAPIEFVARLEAVYEQAKATTKDRVDLALRPQEETPSVPVPGAEKRISIRLTR